MISLCSSNTAASRDESVFKRFDLNNNGKVEDEELSKINLNKIHKSIYSKDTPYLNDKHYKRIDVDNLRNALDIRRDKVIDIKDFEYLADSSGSIKEYIFSLVEFIALKDAFGEYIQKLRGKIGSKKKYRRFYFGKARRQLIVAKRFEQKFEVKSISPTPLPSVPG